MTNTDIANYGRPDDAFASLNPHEEGLGDAIGGGGYGIIGYKGKEWSFRKNRQIKYFKRADGSAASVLDVVILRSPPYKSKSFYPVYEDGAAGKRPVCASLHGDRPDADVTTPLAQVCAMCEKNDWKMQKNGKMGRECQDHMRLAVLIFPSPENKALLGDDLNEPVLLRVPPASLTGLRDLGTQMSRTGFHYSSYVTRLSFEQGMATPKFVYQVATDIRLTKAEAPVILALREDPVSYRITGEKSYGQPAQAAVAVAASSQPRIVASSVSQGVVNGGGGPVGPVGQLSAPSTAKVVEEDEITRLTRELEKLKAAAAQAAPEAVTQVVAAATQDRTPSSSATTVLPPSEPAAESTSELDALVSQLLPR